MPGDWPSKSELFGTFETLSERLDDLDTRVAGGIAAGLPTGGVAGEVLTKDSGTDYDASWQAASGGVDPSQIEVTMEVTRGAAAQPLIFGEDVTDTIVVRGPDGTAGSVPSWFSYDTAVDASFGYGLRFNEEGLYHVFFTITGQWGNCDLTSNFVEFINKVTFREASWGMLHTNIGAASQGPTSFSLLLHAMTPPISTDIDQVNTNIVGVGQYHGFTIYTEPVIGIPAATANYIIELSINRVA